MVRGPGSEVRSPRSEVRGPGGEAGKQEITGTQEGGRGRGGDGRRKTEDRGPNSEVRGRKSEVRGPGSDQRPQTKRGKAGKQETQEWRTDGGGRRTEDGRRRTEGKGGSSFAKATADKEGGIQYPIFNVQYPMSRSPFPNLGGFASWRETDLQARPRPARRSWNISDMRAGMACGDMAIRVALVRHEGVISVDANKREIWS